MNLGNNKKSNVKTLLNYIKVYGLKPLIIFMLFTLISVLYSCKTVLKEDVLKEMNLRWEEKKHIQRTGLFGQDSLLIRDFELHYERETKIELSVVNKYSTEYKNDKYVLYLFFPKMARDIYVILCVKDNQIIGYFNYFPNSPSNNYDIKVWE